jgi:transposase
MMGTQRIESQLFYEFDLDAHVPPNHVLREIDRFLDMGDMREKLKPFYSHMYWAHG